VEAVRNSERKLFAVYLGGRIAKGNTELHDVVFVAGTHIEATYEQLMDKWFGDLPRLHLDSWVELRIVDGHRIELRPEPSNSSQKLFFVNLGAYTPGVFTELHANAFMVAESVGQAKQRAKRELLQGTLELHTDDLLDVDDCLAIDEVDGLHVHLTPTPDTQALVPNNGYHIIPRDVIAAYASRKR
jgi:Domain of Unknown Function (DUF1543)